MKSSIHPLDINTKITTVGPNIFLIKTDRGHYLVEHIQGAVNVDIFGVADRSNEKTY